MFGIDVVTSYLLVMAILTLLVAVLVWHPHRTQRTINVWLASGVLGILLGSIGWFAAARTTNYRWVKFVPPPEGAATSAPSSPGMLGMGGGMGMPGMGKGGGMGGGMGMGPQPKRELTMLVRKLDLLTGDIAITLAAEQAATVADCLKEIEKPTAMSDDEAKAKHEKLMAVLTESQKTRLDAIGLPRPSGRGGMGGPGGSGGMPSMGGPGGGRGGSGAMGGGAPKRDPNENPFQQETEAKALKNLRDRLAPKSPASTAAPKDSGKTAPKDAGKAPARK